MPLIVLALLSATIVKTMSAAELGVRLKPADYYLFTLMIDVIPVLNNRTPSRPKPLRFSSLPPSRPERWALA
ncbi:hypothetical protein BH23ACT4_BH23ACT4_05030 [soil metagenome]